MSVSSSNHLKTPLGPALTKVMERRIQDAVQLTGKALPCSVVVRAGPLVTVKFEIDAAPFTLPQVTIPMISSEYMRLPIRAGCKGVVIPFDVRLGNITGMGSATPPGLDQPANLAAVAFVPISSVTWPDPGADTDLILYSTEDCIVRISPSGVTISGDAGSLVVEGNISAGTGASGTVTTGTGQVMTFQDGICTNIF